MEFKIRTNEYSCDTMKYYITFPYILSLFVGLLVESETIVQK
jgi:hypothetical protein